MSTQSRALAEYARLSQSAPFNLKDPAQVAALMRVIVDIARENCVMVARLAREAKQRGEDVSQALETPDEATMQAFREEQEGLSLLFELIAGVKASAPEGWGGQRCTDWLAAAIPGNLYAKAAQFPEGSPQAAAVNFVSIFSHVYSKFASWEQLMKQFKEPVDPAVLEGMIQVFSKLVSGVSKSVALPEAFQRMDFSEPESGPQA